MRLERPARVRDPVQALHCTAGLFVLPSGANKTTGVVGIKNDFEIRGDVTVIFLQRRDGTVVEGIIDTEDLSKAQSITGRWYADWSKDTESFYVKGVSKDSTGKEVRIRLHRLLTNAPDGYVVDHVNHDTKDNRKSNLRVVKQAENQQNLLSAYRSNKSSGVLGVNWNIDHKKWLARVTVYGTRHQLGFFDTVAEAEQAVKQFRVVNSPYSPEASEARGWHAR